MDSRRLRALRRLALLAGALVLSTGVALAHGGSLRGAAPERLAVPTWLFLLTGGGAVGASFLLASVVTERGFVGAVHEWHATLPAPRRALAWGGGLLGLTTLALVVVAGLAGPTEPLRNAAILVVWVGWWAGFTMSAYLVGDAWPALDPWRRLAAVLPTGSGELPARVGSWPSVAALLLLVWIEVVSPVGRDPQLLALGVVGYTLVTLAGVAVVGDDWFDRVDPLARVFRTYGRVAPVQRTDDGLRLCVPGAALTSPVLDGWDEVAFVVALLWGTTFDGFVTTPTWADAAAPLVTAGVPPHLLYALVLLAGFGLFLGVFRLAVRVSRRTAPTYLAERELAERFALSLVPIAAGYHLAHYLGYFLALSPALASTLAAPLAPPTPTVLAVPGWVGALPIAFVLGGHLLAIWVAHSIAYAALPGRLQAVRSQYSLTLVMVFYTMTSLWVVTRPDLTPPYL